MKHVSLAFLFAVCAFGQRVGPLPGGGFLLNNGWKIHPAGAQIALDTLPMSMVATRDGKYVVALNGGYNRPSLSVIDVAARREISRVPVADAWLGIAFSHDERTLWVGGGSTASIYEFAFSRQGELRATRTLPADAGDFIGDVAVSPDGSALYAADLFHDRILAVDLKSGRIQAKIPAGRRPYQVLFSPDGKSFFVSSWADGTVYEYETASGSKLNAIRVGPHPTGMVWSDKKPTAEAGDNSAVPDWRLFVAAANSNSVYVVGVSGSSAQTIETINIATTPMHPLGMTPSALALSPDGKQLYAVCSDANAIAVVSIEEMRSDTIGFIPTGWYPTAAAALKGGELIVLNGRGAGSHPDPDGNALARQTGSASLIPAFDLSQLSAYSDQVLADSPYRDELARNAEIPAGNPIPPNEDTPTPIQHVVFIVNGGRSYDQVLGDLGKGEGDRALANFGESVTPNQHKLAREFVLFDNFYADGDSDADGLNWAESAIAPDYVQKLWPNSAGGRRRVLDYEGGDPASLPPAGYLWTNALARELSIRNYGHFVVNRPESGAGEQIARVRDGRLAAVTNMNFRGFDPDYPDTKRAEAFLADLKSFEASNNMPRLILMRLSNDAALGQIVDALSHSKFWNRMAIFVVESSAQGGPDHIDSHRSPAFVISPYARRGAVDSTLYDTASALRTLELILGMRPMTQFDAAATPMWRAFTSTPVLTPYDAVTP